VASLQSKIAKNVKGGSGTKKSHHGTMVYHFKTKKNRKNVKEEVVQKSFTTKQ